MSLVSVLCGNIYGFFLFWKSLLISFLRLFIRPSRKSIKGELALVSGAGHGIGRELALELSRLGAVLVLIDINQENNEKTAKEIRANGGKAYSYTCDVTKSENVFQLADQVRKDVGDVSILWNNAGILNGGRILDLSETAIRRNFDVNVISHHWMVQAFLPAMMREGKGHIIGTVSMAAFTPTPTLVDYCASKSAALGFAESLREELLFTGYPNIHVTSLCPYFVSTGLIKEFDDTLNATLTAKETADIGIDGMLRNEELIIAPRHMAFGFKMMEVFPRLTSQQLLRRSKVTIVPQFKKP